MTHAWTSLSLVTVHRSKRGGSLGSEESPPPPPPPQTKKGALKGPLERTKGPLDLECPLKCMYKKA